MVSNPPSCHVGRNCATFFLAQKVLINAKNNQGNTVLHLYILAVMRPAEKVPSSPHSYSIARIPTSRTGMASRPCISQ